MAVKEVLRNVYRCEKPSSQFTDACKTLLTPKPPFLVGPIKSLYHTVQNTIRKSRSKTAGLVNIQDKGVWSRCFQSVGRTRKDNLLCGPQDRWRQMLINPVTFQNSAQFSATEQGFGRRQQQNHDVKATSTSTRWPTYVAGALVLFVTSVWIFTKWREHTLRNRGVNLFHIPNFPLQYFAPFGKYEGTVISSIMLNSVEKARRFNVRTDDVFVISFPRSGTTWTQELVYLVGNEADCDKACSKNLEDRFPYLEDHDGTIDDLDSASSPRYIKTHLPYRLLPKEVDTKKPKIIYVMRNPKDVVVSFYHLWMKLKGGYRGKFSDFIELFLNDQLIFTPWTDHVEDFWTRRHHDNVLFIKYEDLISNLAQEVRRISEFMGKPLTEEQIDAIVVHCSFDNMKKNPSVNYNWWDDRGLTSNMGSSFIRKGRVGDWKNFFTPEMNVRMSQKVDQDLNKMGIEVKYELD